MTSTDIPQHLPSPLVRIKVPSAETRFTNWGLTHSCFPAELYEPRTEDDCQLVLEHAKRQRKRLRAVGVGHSPSDLACTRDYMIRMTKLNKILNIDTEKCVVTAQGGILLNDLHDRLAEYGLAMSCLGSISDLTLAGVIATATHGSGFRFGVIATAVISLTLLLADGSCRTCSRKDNEDLFMASLCGLGATGIILRVQLQVEPAFRLKEVNRNFDFEDVVRNLDKHVHSSEHVKFWWYPAEDVIRASYYNRTDEPKNSAVDSWLWHDFLGYHIVQLLLFVGRYFLPLNNLVAGIALWVAGGDSERVDESHKMFNIDCRYPQYTTEWAIPYENACAFLFEFRKYLRDEYNDPNGIRPHFPIEIRVTAGDDIWLSPAFGGATCWVGIIQYKPYGYPVPYRRFFKAFESIAIRYDGRPHWAKTHPFTPRELRKAYAKFDDFVCVMNKFDASGVWRNEYIDRHIVGKMGEDVDLRVYKQRK